MHTITYASSAKELFSGEALLRLLEKSRDMNARFGITGMLLYRSGNFMQVIEGPTDAIRQLYANICADPAHHSLITLVDEPITQRTFPGWHMGFKDISNQQLASVPGYTDFLDAPEKEGPRGTHGELLLMHFRRSMR